jgi:spermidine/putrescine transport system substrate-binding protein
LKNVSRRFQNAIYDRKLEYSVPYYWGMTGLGYDRRFFKTPPDSWSYIFDPAKRRAYKGKIELLDDMREVVGAALIYLGVNPNSTDPEHLGRARDLIRSVAADAHGFDSESYTDVLAAGTVALAHGWSDEVGRVVAENPQRGFVLPREGFVLWVDNLAVPKASDRQATAHVFFNYLLRPEVAAKLTNVNHVPSSVAGAEAWVAPEIRESPGFTLPEGTPFFILRDLGDALAAIEKTWSEARSGGGK